jgi:uncharacterized repeat protein (TIGR03809 family)
MTQQLGEAIGRDMIARWRALAEQRLEYLTELFETGRWRRFHSEHAFLENIKEAKAAVKTWRELSSPGTSSDKITSDKINIDRFWSDRPHAGVVQREAPLENSRDPAQLPWPAKIPVQAVAQAVAQVDAQRSERQPAKPPENSSILDIGDVSAVAAFSRKETEKKTVVPVQDLTAMITQRYPLLRNRF